MTTTRKKYTLTDKPLDTLSISDSFKDVSGNIRTTIEQPRPKVGSGVLAALKSAVGKDITRISMPVHFNEPLSFLQRLVEDFASVEILDKAAEESDTLKRLAYIAAFACSMYPTSATGFRNYKPFNPLLGETYEYIRPDLGFRSVCEQVSHHPPISAMHAESIHGWIYRQEYQGAVKFRGVMKVIPSGIVSIEFRDNQDRFTFTKQTMVIHNIFFGRMWVDHDGVMTITNHRTGETCDMYWQPYSSVGRKYVDLHGYVKDLAGKAQYTINGRWDQGLVLLPGEIPRMRLEDGATQLKDGDVQLLWKAPTIPDDSKEKYGMSQFAMSLNSMEQNVCPTDSRYRPDQRLLEDGQVPQASEVKRQLEEKQRRARKLRTEEYVPRWFEIVEDDQTGRSWYIYKGDYWDEKATGKFSERENYADIY